MYFFCEIIWKYNCISILYLLTDLCQHVLFRKIFQKHFKIGGFNFCPLIINEIKNLWFIIIIIKIIQSIYNIFIPNNFRIIPGWNLIIKEKQYIKKITKLIKNWRDHILKIIYKKSSSIRKYNYKMEKNLHKIINRISKKCILWAILKIPLI